MVVAIFAASYAASAASHKGIRRGSGVESQAETQVRPHAEEHRSVNELGCFHSLGMLRRGSKHEDEQSIRIPTSRV